MIFLNRIRKKWEDYSVEKKIWKKWEDYSVEKISSSKQIKDPWPHYYIENIFHHDLYSKLVNFWPDIKYFDPQSIAMGDDMGTSNANLREVLLTQDTFLIAENKERKKFWFNFHRFINGKNFIDALFHRNIETIKNIRNDLNQENLILRPYTTLDYSRDGFGVPPHLDSHEYLMTCVFYTPDNTNYKELGTTVLSPTETFKSTRQDIGYEFNDEYLKDEDFNLFKKYDFVPNSLFILIVGPNSYHSLPVIKNADLNRKTISLTLNHQIPMSAFKSLRVRNKKFKNQKKGDYLSHKNYSLNRSKKRFGFF